MNVAGRVFMSAGGGRGLVYWEPATCTPTAITPYVQLNGGSWQQTANGTLASGGSVLFGPQPVTGGSWSWTGPNNFTATTREAGISNIQVSQAGNYVATYTNSSGCQSTQTFNVTVTGSILRQWWTGISGTAISSLTSNANYPNNPTGSGQLTSLEAPTNWADNYGTRIRGYIHPTASGSYTFWVAGDDNTELYLSTSDNPASATRIAYVNGWTNSREWNKYSTQQSATINLVAGQKYYIEVLHKEATGGDNIAVAWQGPGITQQVIAGNYLSPFIPGTGGARLSTQVNTNTINEDAISLYPNPSNGGRFIILLPQISENAVITVYDNLGRKLYEKIGVSGNRIEINSRLKAGLYHVRINSKGFSFTRKLIVK
jgi:hypothetical protein